MSSDIELLEAWRDGDGAAGERLVERHFRAIYRFFLSKLGGDVDDLVQATFLAGVEARDRIAHGSNVRAYLFGIAVRKLHDHLRRAYRQPEGADLSAQSLVDMGTGPSTAIVRRKEHRILLEALRRIPLDLQIAVELTYWEGLSSNDVGRILELPSGTVRTRLRRARELLAARMRELLGSGEPLESTIHDLERWAASLRDGLDTDAQR